MSWWTLQFACSAYHVFFLLSLGFSSTFKMICTKLTTIIAKYNIIVAPEFQVKKILFENKPVNLFLSGFISSLPQLAWEKRLCCCCCCWKQTSPVILDVPTFDKLVFKHYPKTSPDNCLGDQRVLLFMSPCITLYQQVDYASNEWSCNCIRSHINPNYSPQEDRYQ